MKAWDPTDSALAAVKLCRCPSSTTTPTDSALAETNPKRVSGRGEEHALPVGVDWSLYKHKAEWGRRWCTICGHRLFPLVADKTGTMHQNCATLKKGTVYRCGVCGEYILHTGNGKVHENCRTQAAVLGEGEAKRFLHDAVAKRGQKREGEVDYDTAPPPSPKLQKLKAEPPHLPPPHDQPGSDTDPDMPALGPPTPRSTALAERADVLADILTDPDIEKVDRLSLPSNPRPWKLL